MLTATAAIARPESPDPSTTDQSQKVEAAQRFDRALKLFEAGDNEGALAEFKRIYELFADPMVRYNMGLVYAAMGRPVDAVDALEPLVRGDALPPNHLERAKRTLSDQQARIGRLLVKTTPESARIEVDGVQVATTPLSAPIRLSEGRHIIGAVAEGYAPARQEVFIAGHADASMNLGLVRTQIEQLANLTIRTGLVDTEVLVDGTPSGKTPLAASIAVAAGHHVIELRRPGYVTQRRELEVTSGAVGEIALELAVDPASLQSEGATLLLDANESNVEIAIDGKHQGPYRGPLRLPRGRHHVTVSAAGFVPSQREVTLEATQTNTISIALQPTPETRQSYLSSARFHRTWGWVGVIGGTALAGGSVVLAMVSSGQKRDAQSDLDAINLKYDDSQPPCDYRSGFAAEASQPTGRQGSYLCDQTIRDASDRLDSARLRRTIGFVGIGVGSAIAATGLVLLLTGNDPQRFERKSARLRRPGPRVSVAPGPGELGTAVRVSF